MFNIPVVFFIYKRIELPNKFLIQSVRLNQKLYLIADEPKSEDLFEVCKEVREYIENNISWNCNLVQFTQNKIWASPKGFTGLGEVFAHKESAIILEDDTLPNLSFSSFVRIAFTLRGKPPNSHISGCNFYPEIFNSDDSYVFSSFINVWGWATWRRSWKNFDLSMSPGDMITKIYS